ncbi:hypothetical protein N7492_007880 [Penicillium capsulatum]|uniref:Zn(2)-C6 fungal-type domain-containing protein n=1 Tax=Penicillium capsulatum TaxID=69766 RepID=A0A9W9I0M2_9EURO|nr:hypothetical protein N7492_007880 [Penicillium capsulatum]KAJ6117711.1 hypothetical protein N7512_007436 [Penicillium capsulatum]
MDEGADKTPRRKRVSRACDRCRSKKDKCDGLRPTCSSCRASDHACSYSCLGKKRGLPEGYVRGLEKLWALSICNIDGFEESMLAMLGSTAESTARRERLMAVWKDETSSESLHDTWKTSRLYAALEKMLSNSEAPPTTGKRSRSSDELGLGVRVNRDAPLDPDAPRVLESAVSPVKRARLARAPEARTEQSSTSLTLQLPPQTSQLLDVYFAATHSWLPIVAKHNVLRASYLYANTGFSVTSTSPGSGDHAVLWAILSYTVTQSHTDPSTSPVGAVALAKEYYTVSRSLVPSEKERYELGHIQALLLLTLVNMGLEDWTAAWLLSGQAVRMAMAMGLGAFPDRHSEESRQGRAVYLGCFVIDSLLSFRLSRYPAMSSADLTSVGLVKEDGLEEWNSWVDVLPPTGVSHGKHPRRGPLLALSCFNRLVEMASVLNKIARNFSTGYQTDALAQQLVMDLKQWDDSLPLGCRLIGPESIYPERHSALLPHQSYLGLTYVATLLWLYLKLIPGEQGLHRSQRPATEGAKKLLYRALTMMTQHFENFPRCGVPPIFELSLRTIFEQAISLRQMADFAESFPFARWAAELHQKSTVLVWPVYQSLVSSMVRWQQSDLGTYGNAVPRPGISMPADGPSLTPKDTAMMDMSLQTILGGPHTPDSSTTMMAGTATSDSVDPLGFPAGELDAIFHDLAYLDTTEWSNNREAGLKDFGFVDDSTFQAFCHDPDRLGASRPLVHPPSIADIWPPPGFFPETFQEKDDMTRHETKNP